MFIEFRIIFSRRFFILVYYVNLRLWLSGKIFFEMAVIDKFLFVRLIYFTTAFFVLQINLIAAQSKTASKNAKIHSSAHSNAGKQCSFFDGIYTSVMRKIFNRGFHKQLSTEIELMWTTSILPESCRLLIEETLPRGMYVDPDQLRDLSEMGILNTYVPTCIDVEAPEFESESFRVMVFRNLDTRENPGITSVELPVHLRYHKPTSPQDSSGGISGVGGLAVELLPSSFFEVSGAQSQGGSQPQLAHSASSPVAIVRLQNPRLLLYCDGGNIVQNCPERIVTSYCDSTGKTKCEYLQIPYQINVNSLEVSVPVGNSDHTPYVVGLTTFVVSGGTIYLMASIFRTVIPQQLHRQ